MNDKKFYYTFGGGLCLLAAGFFLVALSHPELSFPWPSWTSYILYALYGLYTLLVFLMPRFKDASPANCGLLAMEFLALALIVISNGRLALTGESNWYLPAGLGLSTVANCILLPQRRKRQKKVTHGEKRSA